MTATSDSNRTATGMAMAGKDDNKFDMEGHKKTFQGFTRLLTWSTAVIAVVLLLMALFLV